MWLLSVYVSGIKRRMQPTMNKLLPVTFWKVGLLAIAKWLLSPSVCAHWPVCLSPLSKPEEGQIGGDGNENQLTRQVKTDH